jgi:hypothetical protein
MPDVGCDMGRRVGVVVVDAARLSPCVTGRAVHVAGFSSMGGWSGLCLASMNMEVRARLRLRSLATNVNAVLPTCSSGC